MFEVCVRLGVCMFVYSCVACFRQAQFFVFTMFLVGEITNKQGAKTKAKHFSMSYLVVD